MLGAHSRGLESLTDIYTPTYGPPAMAGEKTIHTTDRAAPSSLGGEVFVELARAFAEDKLRDAPLEGGD